MCSMWLRDMSLNTKSHTKVFGVSALLENELDIAFSFKKFLLHFIYEE